MSLYYIGPRARITNEVFECLALTQTSFAVGQLKDVHIVRPTVAAREFVVPVGFFSSAGASVAGLCGDLPGTVRIVVLLLATLGVLALAAIWTASRHRRLCELRATYQGHPVCLFQTTDVREFGQVSRALQRAIETHRHG